MNTTELVPVFSGELNGQPVQLVNARDLYRFLRISRDFSTWIKKRLSDGGFASGQDYIGVFPQTGENPAGGRPAIDYHLSLETAKHIGMMERSEKGRKIRSYFIECERRAQEGGGYPPELETALSRRLHRMALDHHDRARALLAGRIREYRNLGFSDTEIAARVDREPLDKLGLIKTEDLNPVLGRLGDLFNLINDLADPGPAPHLRRIAR